MTAQPSYPVPTAGPARPDGGHTTVSRLFGELADGERIASLLDLDPDLGEPLHPEEWRLARRRLLTRVRPLQSGQWQPDSLMADDHARIGVLIVDGIILREVLAADVVATELLGPGDIIRPWQATATPALLEAQVRWHVVSETRLALLDGRVAQELGRLPPVMALVVDRLNARAERLAVERAIAHLNRVDERLLAVFWHIAARWGRVTRDGVVLPLTLPHRLLGQLIGARRPTVSTALGQLASDGRVVRRADGTWLLTGGPVGSPEAKVSRFVPTRRRFLAEVPEPPPDGPRPAPAKGTLILERLAQVRAATEHAYAEMQREWARAGELHSAARASRERGLAALTHVVRAPAPQASAPARTPPA